VPVPLDFRPLEMVVADTRRIPRAPAVLRPEQTVVESSLFSVPLTFRLLQAAGVGNPEPLLIHPPPRRETAGVDNSKPIASCKVFGVVELAGHRKANDGLVRWLEGSPWLQGVVLDPSLASADREVLRCLAQARGLQMRPSGAKGHRATTILKTKDQMTCLLPNDLHALLLTLLASPQLGGFAFWPSLESVVRRSIHKQSTQFGLKSRSYGFHGKRSLVVFKQKSADVNDFALYCQAGQDDSSVGRDTRQIAAAKATGPSRPEWWGQVASVVHECVAWGAPLLTLADAGLPTQARSGAWVNIGEGVAFCFLQTSMRRAFFPPERVVGVGAPSADPPFGVHFCCERDIALAPDLRTRLLGCPVQDLHPTAERRGRRRKRTQSIPPPDVAYPVDRAVVVQMAQTRRTLPITASQNNIVMSVRTHAVTVLDGPTGSGKTTQVPQYILDAPGLLPPDRPVVLVTQPRRIAAIAMAQRVAQERGQGVGEEVGYAVRLDSIAGPTTRLLYVTSGILLRRLQEDPDLLGVGCVIIDEVHERTLDIDFCLLIMKRLLQDNKLRVKLVIMSATLQANVFVKYFNDIGGTASPLPAARRTPNHVHFEGRTFSVEPFFMEDALHWTGFRPDAKSGFLCHNQQASVVPCTGILRAALDHTPESRALLIAERQRLAAADNQAIATSFDQRPPQVDMAAVQVDLIAALVAAIHATGIPGAILVFLPGLKDIEEVQRRVKVMDRSRSLLVLPVHSLLPRHSQGALFRPPPRGFRKVILATNIAESSLTVDDVVFVIDSGLTKGIDYDSAREISTLKNVPVSQANVLQRRGRAGRVQPGVAIHLLPRAAFDRLPPTPVSELLRVPLEEVCLRIKALDYANVHSFLACAIDPPEPHSIDRAVQQLRRTGAIDVAEGLTPLGWLLAAMPIAPRLGKLLVLGAMFGVLTPMTVLVAFLSARSPFVASIDRSAEKELRCKRFAFLGEADRADDFFLFLRLYEEWLNAPESMSFCVAHGLHANSLTEVRETSGLLLKNFEADLRFGHSDVYDRNASDQQLAAAVAAMGMYPRTIRSLRGNWYSPFDQSVIVVNANSAASRVRGKNLIDGTLMAYFEMVASERALSVGICAPVTPFSVALVCERLDVMEHFEEPAGPPAEIMANWPPMPSVPKPPSFLCCDRWLFIRVDSDVTLKAILHTRKAVAGQLSAFAGARSSDVIDSGLFGTITEALRSGGFPGGPGREPHHLRDLLNAAASSRQRPEFLTLEGKWSADPNTCTTIDDPFALTPGDSDCEILHDELR